MRTEWRRSAVRTAHVAVSTLVMALGGLVTACGGSDDAGFVQVIQGKTDDPDRLKETMGADSDDFRQERPDIIGGTFALTDDGTFINTVAFTDEASAREGEKRSSPPEDMMSLMRDLTYFDLRDPWFASA